MKKRYELSITSITHYLQVSDETAARAEAQKIIDNERSPERQRYWAGDFPIRAVLREVTDLQVYEIFTPPAS